MLYCTKVNNMVVENNAIIKGFVFFLKINLS